MALKPFLYYLLEEDGRSNYVTSGIVSTRGTPTPLPNTPDGWQDLLLAWERNMAMHGIVRNYSKDLGFVLDGAQILRDAAISTNAERKMYLLIQRLTLEYSATYKWLYEYFYKGELDFTTFKSQQDKVIISIMEGGLSKLLKAHEDTEYTIGFDEDAVNILLDGIALTEKHNFLVQSGPYIGTDLLGALFLTKEGTAAYVASFTVFKQNAPSDYSTDINYFLASSRAVAGIVIAGSISVGPILVGSSVTLRLRSSLGQNIALGSSTGSEIVEFEQSFDSGADEKWFLELDGDTGLTSFELSETQFSVTYTSTYDPTTIKGYLRKDLFRKLCEKIFGHAEYAVSTLLEDDNRIITSRDAIIGKEDAAIKTTLKQFFQDLDTDLMAAMSIESGAATINLPAGQRCLIESRPDVYDESDPVDLGEVKDFEWSFAADLAFAKIKTGWPKPNIEVVNGAYEFNGSNQFTTPYTRSARELNLASPYRAASYEIETTRITQDNRDTTDSGNNNDSFVIVGERSQEDTTTVASFIASGNIMSVPNGIQFIEGQRIRITGSANNNDGEYIVSGVTSIFIGTLVTLDGAALTDEAGVSVQVEWLGGILYQAKRDAWDNQADPDDFGVPSPTTVYNIDLSPKRKLLRHGRWLRSVLHGFDAEKIKFQSGTNNVSLKTVSGSVTVDEDADIDIDTLGEKMFLPFYFDFETKVPIALADYLEADANRCFQFTWDDVQYKGFLFKAALAPNTQEKQQFKLLSAPSNDLTQLI